MAKLSTLPLEDLYQRKITFTVEKEILKKDNFTSISREWCSKVCKLKCKNPPAEIVPKTHVDILIIQDHKALDDVRYGKSGDLLEKKLQSILAELANIGFSDKSISYALTSLLKCKVDKVDMNKGSSPTQTILSKCRSYLWAEIAARKPKVIISLSTAATKVLIDKATNYGNRGEIKRVNLGPESIHGIPVIITLHHRILTMLRQNSSGKFWGPDFFSVICKDFTKAAQVLKGTLKVPDLDRALVSARHRIRIARNLEEVGEMCSLLEWAALEENQIISYDTETTGLDPYSPKAKLLTAQFGYREESGEVHSFVFPLWHRDNTWYNPDEAWEEIKPLLENPEVLKIGHNIKFDVLYTFTTTGSRVRGIFADTMLLLHALNSGIQGNYGLKQAVWDYLPESELGGYEDKLPKLTKSKKEEEEMEDESNS